MPAESVGDAHVVRRWTHWLRGIEPWYLSYGLLGIVMAGLVPMLVPLIVSGSGSAGYVGLVMGALSLGGLTAPLWGLLADRLRWHRWLLTGGLLAIGTAAGLFGFSASLGVWLGLALLLGLGATAAGTVASLFVVEAHPRDEWDQRIGALQSFWGGGQVAGLVLAGFLSNSHRAAGLLIAAGLAALATLVAGFTTRTPAGPPRNVAVRPHLARHGEWAFGFPSSRVHHLSADIFRQLGPMLRSPFGLFLIVWLTGFTGSSAFIALYPVVMQQAYGIAPACGAASFAVAAVLGLPLYAVAGRWCEHASPGKVFRSGLSLRFLAMLGLAISAYLPEQTHAWTALVCFTGSVLAWSFLSVSGTALAAQLAPGGEGTGLGIFNATGALAGVIGASVGGWAAQQWSYSVVVWISLVGLGLALLLTVVLEPSMRVPTAIKTVLSGKEGKRGSEAASDVRGS